MTISRLLMIPLNYLFLLAGAVCARFTCHELGLQCDASEDLPVPFSLQALKGLSLHYLLDQLLTSVF